MFISELHVKGYKRLLDVKIPFNDLTVLIGPNACGKSSVLEVLDLLRAGSSRDLSESIGSRGLKNLLSRGAQQPWMTTAYTSPGADGTHLVYELSLVAHDYDYAVSSELLGEKLADGSRGSLYLRRDGPAMGYYDDEADEVTPDVAVPDTREPALPQTPGWLPPPAQDFRIETTRLRQYGLLNTGPGAAARMPQQVRPSTLPNADGEYLLAALQTTRSRTPDMFEFLQDSLRAAYPGFEGIDLEPVAAGQVVLTWRERGETYYGNELSDGVLRFLFLATILCASDPPPLIMIDEPEMSLHPDLLRILVDLLREAASNGQVIVATQSPTLISFLEPADLLVMDIDDEGWATATPATDMDIDKWLEDYTLGQLWTKGVLGGLP